MAGFGTFELLAIVAILVLLVGVPLGAIVLFLVLLNRKK